MTWKASYLIIETDAKIIGDYDYPHHSLISVNDSLKISNMKHFSLCNIMKHNDWLQIGLIYIYMVDDELIIFSTRLDQIFWYSMVNFLPLSHSSLKYIYTTYLESLTRTNNLIPNSSTYLYKVLTPSLKLEHANCECPSTKVSWWCCSIGNSDGLAPNRPPSDYDIQGIFALTHKNSLRPPGNFKA